MKDKAEWARKKVELKKWKRKSRVRCKGSYLSEEWESKLFPGKSLSCLPLELVVGHLNKTPITFLVFSVG